MARGLTRRAVLAGGATAAALWALPRGARAAPPARRELIFGALQYAIAGKPGFAFVAYALDGTTYAQWSLGFHSHGFAPHPNRRRAAVFEKHGPGACELDLVEKRVLRPITTSPERQFYGHGAYSPDGETLYATETVMATYEGVILVRKAATLEPLGELPTFGHSPHDCVLLDGGRTLVVTNGGGRIDQPDRPASVTFVDVKRKKLIEKLTFTTPRINAGHLALTRRRELVVVSAPRKGLPDGELGGVSMRAPGQPLRTMSSPAEVTDKMRGETLSLAIHEPSAVVGVTNPDGDLVTFWDHRRGKLVKSVTLPHPRGITLTRDQQWFVISCGRPVPSLHYVSTRTLDPDPARPDAIAPFTGSHMYTWEI